MRRLLLLSVVLAAAIGGATYKLGYASDHDDGETDIKARALNLSDHFAFRSPASPDELSLIMYFNPRSLPGTKYLMSTNARYEFHVSRAASRTSAPTAADDFVFRFEAGPPDATGVQPVHLTVLQDGKEIATHDGMTTNIASSKADAITTNTTTVLGKNVRYFIGPRADSFSFDVVRFFQVRRFLADRFFGGANGKGNANATLADNCRGDKFLAGLLPGGVAQNEAGGVSDGDNVNLFNPPSCAPDFTKNLNVTAIVMNIPFAALQKNGETVFDTWSTISVPE